MNKDIVIAGAGIVGLATAYQLLCFKPSLKILVLEKEPDAALHQTGRNSGVVHTGVYYKPETLKAKNCIAGRKELLAFCDAENIPYQKKHKLIVATDPKELPRLQQILSNGRANGVPGLKLISKSEALELEPNVNVLQALYVPECHIISYKQVADSLVRWIRNNGGEVLFNEPVEQVEKKGDRCLVIGKNRTYESQFFINCAGLYSDRIAQAGKAKMNQRILPFRGEYYELSEETKGLVNGLIYPIPDPQFPFLGVHLTPMVNGKVEAGPNAVLAFAREGYRKTDFNWNDTKEIFSYPGFWMMAFKYWRAGLYETARSMSKQLFLRDLRRLVPAINESDLKPGGAGIRAQVVNRDGNLHYDFAFLQEGNILHVINAPSPAATASFSIGRTLAQMVKL